jgi:5-formyltetrahydrofolate cyclo-ligase
MVMKPQPPANQSSGNADQNSTQLRASLRKKFKQRRSNLTTAARASASLQIAARLADYVALQHAVTVAAFVATPTEVDLAPWIHQHLQTGGGVVLPRVGDHGSMEFYRYTAATPLEDNRFGIGEPPASSPHVEPRDIDAVLAPLVAFDSLGHRLGMGGGYYDRYLPRLGRGTPLIGVAFACQQTDAPLPREAWDVPLHAVVTEIGVLEWPSIQ